MKKIHLLILSLVFVLCTSFIKLSYYVQVFVPVSENCWTVLAYVKGEDSVHVQKCYSNYAEREIDKVFPVSQFPSIKKIYKYNFKELEKLCEPLKDYNFSWEKDAVIIVKHVGMDKRIYKLKLSVKGNKKQEKLKQLIVELK